MWDISPNSIGNAEIPTDPEDFPEFYNYFDGGDASQGYPVNPVTGEVYEEQWVPRGDYTRVLAEFWADGPDSKTPPGHWFLILNYVNDHPLFVKRLGGTGPVLGALEWDVKAYLALGGCMHDSAVASWGVKGWYDYVRPITAIRWMAEQGQRTDPLLSNYHPQGLRLIPGLIEVITEESTAPGERHEHLVGKKGENIGKIGCSVLARPRLCKGSRVRRCWRGMDSRRALVAVSTTVVCHAAVCGIRLRTQHLQPIGRRTDDVTHRKPILPWRAWRIPCATG